MQNELEGAKEARKIIKRFYECLNSPRLVPEQCYRPNHATYTLVNYVNQITGLFLSKNYSVIPIFINRAFKRLNEIRDDLVSEPYRQIVLSYLNHMAYFINEYCEFEFSETQKTLIPKELLEQGRQEAPPITFLPGEF
jgi:hypothetical protein